MKFLLARKPLCAQRMHNEGNNYNKDEIEEGERKVSTNSVTRVD